MAEVQYPDEGERLRSNIREEIWAQRGIGDLPLDEVVIDRLASAIATNIKYAFEVRWSPDWVKNGGYHHWTEIREDGSEQHYVDCLRCRRLAVHDTALEAAGWWNEHVENDHRTSGSPAAAEPIADANVDFGVGSGYFVRLDVELESFDARALPRGHYGDTALVADEAEALAESLLTAASRVRELSAEDDQRLAQAGRPPRRLRRPQ